MRKIVIALALVGISPALAQQPPQDPQVAVYRQLLDASNAQLAQTVAQASQQIESLKKQIADLQKQVGDVSKKTEEPQQSK